MRNTKNELYHKLLNTSRWQNLRSSYLQRHPVCEKCEENGRTRLATCVHHIIPVEDAKDAETMESLAFDGNNLMALCSECHDHIHKDLGSRFKAGKKCKRREAQRIADDFLKKWCK